MRACGDWCCRFSKYCCMGWIGDGGRAGDFGVRCKGKHCVTQRIPSWSHADRMRGIHVRAARGRLPAVRLEPHWQRWLARTVHFLGYMWVETFAFFSRLATLLPPCASACRGHDRTRFAQLICVDRLVAEAPRTRATSMHVGAASVCVGRTLRP